jgi:hypothetical protein
LLGHVKVRPDAYPSKADAQLAQGQTDDVAVTALNLGHRIEGSMLDGIRPSLVEWIAALNVTGEFFV